MQFTMDYRVIRSGNLLTATTRHAATDLMASPFAFTELFTALEAYMKR